MYPLQLYPLLTRRSRHIRNTGYPSPSRPYPPKQPRNYSPPLPYPTPRPSSNLEDDESYHLMKLNSSTFVCTLPHFHPTSAIEDDTTALTKAEEEKERHRARKRGWELLRPLEGNCMYFVLPPGNHLPQALTRGNVRLLTCWIEYRMVDIRILPQPLRKTIPRPPARVHCPALPPGSRPYYRSLYPRPNTRLRTPSRHRSLRAIPVPTRRGTNVGRRGWGTTVFGAENGWGDMV